jgi:hypothetical protein
MSLSESQVLNHNANGTEPAEQGNKYDIVKADPNPPTTPRAYVPTFLTVD